MNAAEEIIHFAELDAARLRGKELDIRTSVVAGLLNKDNLAQVLAKWKPFNGETISKLAKKVTVREEWELQSHWQRIYWAFQDALQTGEYIRLSVSSALYAVREYGTPAEYSAVLDELEELSNIAADSE